MGEKGIPFAGSLPNGQGQVRPKPTASSKSPCGCKCPGSGTILFCFPRHFSSELGWKWSNGDSNRYPYGELVAEGFTVHSANPCKFNFLHLTIQLSQHYLLKAITSPLNHHDVFVKNQLNMNTGLCQMLRYSIALHQVFLMKAAS